MNSYVNYVTNSLILQYCWGVYNINSTSNNMFQLKLIVFSNYWFEEAKSLGNYLVCNKFEPKDVCCDSTSKRK